MQNKPMTQAEKDNIVQVLNSKKAVLPCPRCGQNKFTLADGYLNSPLQQNLNGITIGGPSIPSVAVVCTNCGYISQHALGVLGLLPPNPVE